MAETLSLWSAISFVIAGIGLGAAVFFWFFFKIPSVIGGLTGRTARKSIEKMRASDEKAGNKFYCENRMNKELGMPTEPLKRNMQFTVQEKDFVMLEEIILIHTDETIE